MRRDDNLANAAPHPVLHEPHTYFVAGVHADFSAQSQRDCSLVLVLARNDVEVRLRFEGVEDLQIEAGFPYRGSGLQILDVTYMQWDGIRIRVTSFEQDPAIRFWARRVDRLTA